MPIKVQFWMTFSVTHFLTKVNGEKTIIKDSWLMEKILVMINPLRLSLLLLLHTRCAHHGILQESQVFF